MTPRCPKCTLPTTGPGQICLGHDYEAGAAGGATNRAMCDLLHRERAGGVVGTNTSGPVTAEPGDAIDSREIRDRRVSCSAPLSPEPGVSPGRPHLYLRFVYTPDGGVAIACPGCRSLVTLEQWVAPCPGVRAAA